jgi:DNA polymerase/3'-5' exonuclease PolX
VRAYRTGAEVVESFSGDIMKLAAENQLAGIKGLGEALRDKLHEMATTGRLEFYEKLKAEFPDTIFELFDVQGLGPKKIAALHAELGVSSIADLKRACESGEAAKLSGFGARRWRRSSKASPSVSSTPPSSAGPGACARAADPGGAARSIRTSRRRRFAAVSAGQGNRA